MNPGKAPPSSSPPPPRETYKSAAADEDQVMSEVHLGCPPNYSGAHLSRFTFSLSPEAVNEGNSFNEMKKEASSIHHVVSFDEDGDLVVTRRTKRCEDNYVLTIKHNITTSIPSVGLQIWRAELVLADFVLHKMVNTSDFHGVIAIELGAGTGLVGMLLARDAKTVFLTGMRFAWSTAELEYLQKATLIVAADVIYSDDLTDAFFNTLEKLVMLGQEKVIYLALEKRYNFSLDDLNVVANGYSCFQSYLEVKGDSGYLNIRSIPRFVGKCLDLAQIPQYIREYDRGNDVEIWEIKYEK